MRLAEVVHDFKRELVSEGACPYGHGLLRVAELHGRQQGSCAGCGCSWYVEDGAMWACACIPGDHTCRREHRSSGPEEV